MEDKRRHKAAISMLEKVTREKNRVDKKTSVKEKKRKGVQ